MFCNGDYELLYEKIIRRSCPIFYAEYFVCIMHGIGMRCITGRDAWFMEHDFVLTKLIYVPFFFQLQKFGRLMKFEEMSKCQN